MSHKMPLLVFSVFMMLFCRAEKSMAQAETLPAPVQSAAPSSFQFAASRTHAVPAGDKQDGKYRVLALYSAVPTEREGWTEWQLAAQPIRDFLAARDKTMAATLQTAKGAAFRVYDLDGDKKNDLIVRYGSYEACVVNVPGCGYLVYYADRAKKRVVYYARKFLPAKGGVSLNNKFFAILPQGGETFTAVSDWMYDPSSPFDMDKRMLVPYVQQAFPDYYKTTMSAPGFRYFKYDLDKDGRPEYVVAIADDDGEFGLCVSGNAASMCPVLVYTQKSGADDLMLIGTFDVLPQMVFARTNARGYADIITAANGQLSNQTVTYFMNSQAGLYELEK